MYIYMDCFLDSTHIVNENTLLSDSMYTIGISSPLQLSLPVVQIDEAVSANDACAMYTKMVHSLQSSDGESVTQFVTSQPDSNGNTVSTLTLTADN